MQTISVPPVSTVCSSNSPYIAHRRINMSSPTTSASDIKPLLFYRLLVKGQIAYYDYMLIMGALDWYDYILPDRRFVFPSLNFLFLSLAEGNMKKAWAWSWMAECLSLSEQITLMGIIEREKRGD
jgi:hypothetical protein